MAVAALDKASPPTLRMPSEPAASGDQPKGKPLASTAPPPPMEPPSSAITPPPPPGAKTGCKVLYGSGPIGWLPLVSYGKKYDGGWEGAEEKSAAAFHVPGGGGAAAVAVVVIGTPLT